MIVALPESISVRLFLHIMYVLMCCKYCVEIMMLLELSSDGKTLLLSIHHEPKYHQHLQISQVHCISFSMDTVSKTTVFHLIGIIEWILICNSSVLTMN